MKEKIVSFDIKLPVSVIDNGMWLHTQLGTAEAGDEIIRILDTGGSIVFQVSNKGNPNKLKSYQIMKEDFIEAVLMKRLELLKAGKLEEKIIDVPLESEVAD